MNSMSEKLVDGRIRVLYETSVLGQGSRFSECRTGIFRVIDNIVRGIAASGECALTTCVTTSAEWMRPTRKYLDSNSCTTGLPLLPEGHLKAKILWGVGEMRERLVGRTLPTRVVRRALWEVERRLSVLPVKIKASEFSKFDVFHSGLHRIPPQIRSASRIKKFQTVYDLIPLLHPELFKDSQNDLIRQMLGSLTPEDWVVCISHSTRNDFLELCKWADPARVIVTHLAASELFYRCTDQALLVSTRKRFGIPAEVQYCLSVATLEPRKNIDGAIYAFAELLKQERIPDLYLVLVGTQGWDFDRILDAAAALRQFRERVIFTGFVPDCDLAPLYSGALCFVYPSFYEGFGLPPLEAMQCGTPAITSNTSSLPEVVGEAAIMVDPHDRDALAHSMLELYCNRELHRQMSERALQQAARFSWARCAQETIAGYRAAIAGTAASDVWQQTIINKP